MSRSLLAIALCRVSSVEQLQNNSLNQQKGNVLKAAEKLGATIPNDGVWEGQVSSKVGVNFNRKDLLQMFDYCKKHSAVKYLIVQEVDRFMRSPDEQTYWYVRFWYELRVRVWFADKPELNEETHVASLLRYMEGWRAAGSNEERKNKSINGQTAALKEGRYPFSPKPGYTRGHKTGIQEVHPVRGPALKMVLERMASHLVTPSQALVELNKSEFMKDGHAFYKMDKFRKIVTDPFYAGVVEINQQVKIRNEYGLHEPLITKEQHYELLRIMNSKEKNQGGPRKNGNPDFPLSNHVSCDLCKDKTNGRYVGFNHSNGKNPLLVYYKYRCRGCARYIAREELNPKIQAQFKRFSEDGIDDLVKALDIVWQQKEDQAEQDANRIRSNISDLAQTISDHVEAATDPSNASIKDDILNSIAKKKAKIADMEEELSKITRRADSDRERFLRFAFAFIEQMGSRFLEISPENRVRCKLILFPAGFWLDAENKVYTPQISPLYGLATNKKGAEAPLISHLVRVKGL